MSLSLPSPKTPLPRYLSLPCGGAGVVLLVLAALRVFALARGTAGAHLFVLAVLLGLAALALVLLWQAGLPRHWLFPALLPVALALFLRVLCLDHITLDYENFLSVWAEFFRENGGFAAIRYPVGNYNAPYLYFMAAISYLPVPDLYCIKLFSMLFDVLLAWGGARLVRHFSGADSWKPWLAFAVLLLLPTPILNGAYWGQCDALYGALVVHALSCALDRRSGWSVVWLAVAFSFKLQTIFLIPLWGVLWLTGRVKFRHLCLFPATYVLTILPALLLGKPLGDILGVYLGQTAEYADRLTLNAPSVYALIPSGAEVDHSLAFYLGIAAAFLLVLSVFLILFLVRDRVTDQVLMTVAVIFAVGIPFLLPSMHERYFFLADVLTVAWACISPRRLPQAIAVQFASLGAYHAYLTLRYAFYITLFGQGWGMLLEALVFLAVLVSSLVILAGQVRALPPKKAPAAL